MAVVLLHSKVKTPLHAAALNGFLDVVKYLCSAAASALGGHLDVVQYLCIIYLI